MVLGPQNLAENVRSVRTRIALAAARCDRNADSITLVAASKAQPFTAIEAAAAAGLQDFGESYVQEALAKLAAPQAQALTWHFIGRIQANKTRAVAEHFAWVHGLDRLEHARRLAAQRPYHAPALNVCIQVNLAGEPGKSGAAAADVRALAGAVAELPRLRLRGLMCLPPRAHTLEQQRRWFAELRGMFEDLNAHGARLDALSMGMSEDLEAAVLEGATHVRIGTAIFGPRPRRHPREGPDTIRP
jgi:PLP dependent protein